MALTKKQKSGAKTTAAVKAPAKKSAKPVSPKNAARYAANAVEMERRKQVKRAEREARVLQRREERKAMERAVEDTKPKVARRAVGSPKPNLVLERIPGKVGRPSIAYTDELDAKLFELVSTGVCLDDIGMMPDMPNVGTLLSWIHNKDHKFSARYLHAKSVLATLYEERAHQVALKPMMQEVVTVRDSDQFGRTVDTRTVDNVARATLAFNAYQWSLSHMMPKKHGKNAEPDANKPNEQLEALFAALKSGPKDTDDGA